MIKSFKSKDTERLFNRRQVPRWHTMTRVARRKLEMLNAAKSLGEFGLPLGN